MKSRALAPILPSHVAYFQRMRVRFENQAPVNLRANLSSADMTMLDYLGVDSIPYARRDDKNSWHHHTSCEVDWRVAFEWLDKAERIIADEVARRIKA